MRFSKDNRGFTLIELILVLLVTGIMSAVVAGINSVNTYEIAGELEKVKSHIRYARIKAMKTDFQWGICFETSKKYYLFQNDVITRKRLPDEENLEATLSSLNISSTPQTVTFDGFGSPGADDMTISTNGGTIHVAANTGWIE
jgi:prepilin-type N-terminal cleavage/methylation domain-containing protein